MKPYNEYLVHLGRPRYLKLETTSNRTSWINLYLKISREFCSDRRMYTMPSQMQVLDMRAGWEGQPRTYYFRNATMLLVVRRRPKPKHVLLFELVENRRLLISMVTSVHLTDKT